MISCIIGIGLGIIAGLTMASGVSVAAAVLIGITVWLLAWVFGVFVLADDSTASDFDFDDLF